MNASLSRHISGALRTSTSQSERDSLDISDPWPISMVSFVIGSFSRALGSGYHLRLPRNSPVRRAVSMDSSSLLV